MKMFNNTFTIYLLIIVTFQICIVHAGTTSYRNSGGYNRRNYYGSQLPPSPPVTETPPQTPKQYLNSKSGFSTFGIISIIFAVIVCCLVFYYGIMCYPFLCHEEKRYHFMDVSSTLTTATSRSMQSIENYPVDQKH